MLPRPLFVPLACLGLSSLAVAPAAQAHIRLLDPVARYDVVGETGIKSCPCGLGSSNRICNVAVDGSDPDRSTRVRRAEAGSTITLRFVESIDHSGSFRVAFDPEGADVADFNANILVPIVPDPPGGAGNVGEGNIWEIDVELPDMTCSQCTLQLIQAMHGDMVNPVTDPTNTSSYYACVDLELVPRGTLDDMGGTAEPEAGDPGPMGTPDDPMPAAEAPAGSNPGAMGSNGGSMGSSGSSMNSSGGAAGSNLGSAPAMAADTTSSNAVAMLGNGVGTGNVGAPATSPMGNSQSPGGLINIPAQGSDASSTSSGGCGLGTERTSGSSVLAAVGLLSALSAGRRLRRRR